MHPHARSQKELGSREGGRAAGTCVHVGRMSLFRSYTYRVHLFQEWGNGGGQHTIHHITHLGGEEGERRGRETGERRR